MSDAVFATGKDYDVPLLRVLCKLPGGQGKTAEVCRIFEAEYRDRIPDEDRGMRSNGQAIWYNNVCWSRNNLRKRGFLAKSKQGVWQVNDKGRQWLEQNPNETSLDGVPDQPNQRRRKRKTSSAPPPVPGLSLAMLEQTRKAMPADQFRQVWGTLYDQLLAEERAKAVTQITQTELGRRTRRWLDEVHAFLSGTNAKPPSSETLCDWIQFCYALELHREAAALLPFVQEDDVDPGSYKRARRVAEVCRSKVTG
jgi:hypothetical protein